MGYAEPSQVRVLGPRGRHEPCGDSVCVDLGHGARGLYAQLHPGAMGPVDLYGGRRARTLEKAWAHIWLYPKHADDKGEPTYRYWRWAQAGWGSRERRPGVSRESALCALWGGRRLSVAQARAGVFIPLYRRFARQTRAFEALVRHAERGREIVLRGEQAVEATAGGGLWEAVKDESRGFEHSFVVAMMLVHGEDFTISDLSAAHGDMRLREVYPEQRTLTL